MLDRVNGMDFQERQKQLCHLSSFVNEQEKWLDSVLGKLQWTRENLSSVRVSQDTNDPLPI